MALWFNVNSYLLMRRLLGINMCALRVHHLRRALCVTQPSPEPQDEMQPIPMQNERDH